MIHFDSEKCMEDFFFLNYGSYTGHFDLLPSYEWKAYRQVQLGAHGTCDILFVAMENQGEGCLTIHIRLVELKNTELSHSHVSQVARYADFFTAMAEESSAIIDFRASLVGLKTFPGGSDLVYLCQSIEWLDVFEVSLTPLHGLRLKNVCGWKPSAHASKAFGDFLRAYGAKEIAEQDYGQS